LISSRSDDISQRFEARWPASGYGEHRDDGTSSATIASATIPRPPPKPVRHPNEDEEPRPAAALADAARRVLADLAADRDPKSDDLAAVLDQLRRRIARSFPDLDAQDVVQSTMTRLLGRSEPLPAAEIDNAWGYLVMTTRNAAIDAIRARQRRHEVPSAVLPDRASPEDAIAALIDRQATNEAVLAALRALIASGDALTVPIITTWLDMADELDRSPSTREVAPRAGVSHTTVAQALSRFRVVLAETLGADV
jgi:RNA polymerase sigma factor (sigma-70 family)